MATPLLLALAVIELSDVVFAVDSIPAVFGVTLDPFIIYTSNMFAIFSLRALFGFVSTVMTELRFLDKVGAEKGANTFKHMHMCMSIGIHAHTCTHAQNKLRTLKYTNMQVRIHT